MAYVAHARSGLLVAFGTPWNSTRSHIPIQRVCSRTKSIIPEKSTMERHSFSTCSAPLVLQIYVIYTLYIHKVSCSSKSHIKRVEIRCIHSPRKCFALSSNSLKTCRQRLRTTSSHLAYCNDTFSSKLCCTQLFSLRRHMLFPEVGSTLSADVYVKLSVDQL